MVLSFCPACHSWSTNIARVTRKSHGEFFVCARLRYRGDGWKSGVMTLRLEFKIERLGAATPRPSPHIRANSSGALQVAARGSYSGGQEVRRWR
jgi:hypothetical protein